ncbi:hypothetical protein [Mesorhizobium japonicum]|uniref:hypothetical protein n=1 Tax=Mesorhizobium japonicum TaxID=2066070 RepID=UPI003B5B7AD0
MSNINIYNPGANRSVSKAIARETAVSLAVTRANAEVHHAKIQEAGVLFNRAANDVVNAVAFVASAEAEVPGSSRFTAPLLRSYAQLVGELVSRGVR